MITNFDRHWDKVEGKSYYTVSMMRNGLRTDNRVLRAAILDLTQPEPRKQGIGKSTLSYPRKKARCRDSFMMYDKTCNNLTAEAK
jgi:hypothetical protein